MIKTFAIFAEYQCDSEAILDNIWIPLVLHEIQTFHN